MSTIRIAITGAAGRMGKTLIQAIQEAPDLTLGAAFEHAQNPLVGQDAGEVSGVGALGVEITADPRTQLALFDVAVDFTVPDATLALAEACAEGGQGLVVGTTGFTDAQLAQLHTTAADIALFMAPNMSVGVNLTFKLIEIAARALGDTVDVEVLEAHHRHKIDAPSGTAVRMGEVLADALGRDLDKDAIYGREGITGARERRTIGFSTMRGGDIVGEHTVMFAGEGERIEITHRAQSRMNFAQGALRAARFVHGQAAGRYDMQGLLNL
ncbi:MAG: 4-hydroxy-tetrahydrodipicolinate reductase [Pseudomonadota bacterium]